MIDVSSQLRVLLGNSTPGDTLHHLLVTSISAQGKPETIVYAIAPDQSVDAGDYVANVIRAATVEADDKRRVIEFAGLSMEVHLAALSAPGAATKRAQHRLHEHPQAFEATIMYAAARDGRRWVGHHYLTGPEAGPPNGPTELTGPIRDDERGLHRILVRSAVGLPSA